MRVERSQNLPGRIHTLKVTRERQVRLAFPCQRAPRQPARREFTVAFQHTRCARGGLVAVDADVDGAGPGVERDCCGELRGAGGLEDDVGPAFVQVRGVDEGAFDGAFCYAEVSLAPAGEFHFQDAWLAMLVSGLFGLEGVVCLQDIGHDGCVVWI